MGQEKVLCAPFRTRTHSTRAGKDFWTAGQRTGPPQCYAMLKKRPLQWVSVGPLAVGRMRERKSDGSETGSKIGVEGGNNDQTPTRLT